MRPFIVRSEDDRRVALMQPVPFSTRRRDRFFDWFRRLVGSWKIR